jgi:anthranilate phosphoribosyltransferase
LDVLKDLGSSHVLIVAAEDGLDEISNASSTTIGELINGEISIKTIAPEDFGIKRINDYRLLQVDSPDESLALLKKALTYEHQVAGDIVALNAGAAIYAANLKGSLADGVAEARLILRSGDALIKLEKLVAFTQNVGK